MKTFTAILAMWIFSALVIAAEPSFDARLSQYEYPYPVKHFQLNTQRQSLEMAYMHLPAEEGKATVLLMHGKNFAADYWQGTAEFLRKRGYGVLMPDQIGFGKSSKPAHYQFSAEALVANTQALVQKLGISDLVVMGHSMGGMLASRYALNYADQVQELVLINPVGLEDYLKYVEYKDPEFFYNNELKKTAADVLAYQRKNYYDGQWREAYEALTTIHKEWMNAPD